MKEETYICDLCKETRDRDYLYALFADACHENVMLEYGQPNWHDCHRHICKMCVEVIKAQSKWA